MLRAQNPVKKGGMQPFAAVGSNGGYAQ